MLITLLIFNFQRPCRHFLVTKTRHPMYYHITIAQVFNLPPILMHNSGTGSSLSTHRSLVQIPDKALCDSYLYGIFFAEVRIIKAQTHEKLNEVIRNFLASLDDKEPSETLGCGLSLQKTGGSCSESQHGK